MDNNHLRRAILQTIESWKNLTDWHPLGKTYVVYAKGIDRTKLRFLVGNVQEN